MPHRANSLRANKLRMRFLPEKDDPVKRWIIGSGLFVLDEDESVQRKVAEVVNATPKLLWFGAVRKSSSGDAFLIATAIEYGLVIITEESKRSPIKVSQVAALYGVESLSISELAEREGWRFPRSIPFVSRGIRAFGWVLSMAPPARSGRISDSSGRAGGPAYSASRAPATASAAPIVMSSSPNGTFSIPSVSRSSRPSSPNSGPLSVRNRPNSLAYAAGAAFCSESSRSRTAPWSSRASAASAGA